MAEENISQEFRMKNITDQDELVSYKHKKICTTLNYIELFLILTSAVTGCISISALGSTSSAIGLKISAITAGIKKYKSMIKKKA